MGRESKPLIQTGKATSTAKSDDNASIATKTRSKFKVKSEIIFKGGVEELHNHYFDCASVQSADRFVTTLKAIYEHVGRTYQEGGDIRSTLENLKQCVIDPPIDPADSYSDILTNNNRVSKTARDQVPYLDNEVFRQEINTYVKQKAQLKSNMRQAYSLVLGQCTDRMKNKLKACTNWETLSTKQDVLGLLNEIKGVTFRFEDQKYHILSIHNAKAAFYSFRQLQLSNAEYHQRFNNLVDIATSLGGNLHDDAVVAIVSKDLHDMDEPRHSSLTAEQIENVQIVARERYLAVALIAQADRRRFGKLQDDLENAFTMGNNNYPKTIDKAFGLLNDFKVTQPKVESMSKQGLGFAQTKFKPEQKPYACPQCGKQGVSIRNCPVCRKRKVEEDKPKEKEKFKPKVKQETTQVTFTNDMDDDGQASITSGFGALQFTLNQVQQVDHPNTSEMMSMVTSKRPSILSDIDLKSCILLDSQSTVHAFCHPGLVERVWSCKDKMSMATNGGVIDTYTQCKVKGLDQPVWFSPQYITNILSLGLLSRLFRITYDSAETSSFIVHRPNKTDLVFHQHKSGLHCLQVDVNKQVALVETVAENASNYSNRQLTDAKRARSLIHSLGFPSEADVINIIRLGIIKNCPVTVSDVKKCYKYIRTTHSIHKRQNNQTCSRQGSHRHCGGTH